MALAPGLALVALAVAASFAFVATGVVPGVGPSALAVLVGALLAPVARRWDAAAPGIELAARHLLRAGIVLLGLQVTVGQMASLGLGGLLLVAGTVAATMGITIPLGRRIGVDRSLTLLIASGTAICGASAIAAVGAVDRAARETVAYAIAMITAFGTAAMFAIPALAVALGLSDRHAGLWVGASVHEVAQVVAAGAAISPLALETAVLVKLGRVASLVPMIMLAGRAAGRGPDGRRARIPGFLLGFLALVAVRTATDPGEAVLDACASLSSVLLAAALAALGMRLTFGGMSAAGGRPVVLAFAASVTAALAALGLALAVG